MPAGASPPPHDGSSPDDKRLETVRLDALTGQQAAAPDVGHRAIARRLLKGGQREKAVTELIRLSREQPMSSRMAHALCALGLTTGKTGPIQTVVTQGIDEAEGRERVGVMRALARLQRRSGQLPEAVETLTVLLAEAPEDRRSRLILNALLERFERWDELDASLDKETRLLLKRRYFRAASRVALKRARLWGERLQEHPRAALRYGQAAQYAEQGQDPHSVFLLRMLWLRALVNADSPARSIDEATRVVLEQARVVGKEARARAFVRELGLALPTPKAADVHEGTSSEEEPTASTVIPAATTLSDLEAVEAEPAPTGPVGEALLVAAASSPLASNKALTRLEARYVARGAWKELAKFYRETADARGEPKERAPWLEKLAELLESELEDADGAAKVWAEVAQLTGDSDAVSEQVRILDERQDQAGVKKALDAGVGRAQSPSEKARLLVLRAQEARARGDAAQARADYEAALSTFPGSLEAAAGLAELSVARGDAAPVRLFEKALAATPRSLPERPGYFRRLARLADTVKDARLAISAWSAVVQSVPHDDEALGRVWVLARGQRDDGKLEQVLRALLAKDPRGERARLAWLDLVSVLERAGRFDDALAALREAVKAEPGHLQAWLSLIDRLLARRLDDEASWAFEHAATSAPEGPQRVSLWRRHARHARERLDDEEKAEKYEERIERVRAEQAPAAHAAARLPGGPLTVPSPRTSSPRLAPVVAVAAQTLSDEVESETFARALGAAREAEDSRPPLPPKLPPRLKRVLDPIVEEFSNRIETREAPADEFASDDDIDEVMEVRSDEVAVVVEQDATPVPAPTPPASRADAPSTKEGQADAEAAHAEEAESLGRPTQELPAVAEPVSLGDPEQPVPPSFGPSPAKQLSEERQALFERVRASPLDPDGYRMLAEHFDTASDAARSSLMLELARALEGDPNAAPRTPRLLLSATDRAGLRHPLVRTEAAELVTLAGPALCRLFPAKGKDATTTEEFSLESGKGAKPAADALLAAVRLLGMRAPDVFVSDEGGPPFSAVQTSPARLVVSRLAVKKPQPDAELRFYAGRALFTVSAELLALRTLKRDQLRAGLDAVGQMLKGQASTEARLLREVLPARSLERLKVLWPKVAKSVDLAALMEGARHSVNRAGLIVCGGIAPVIASLRAKRALPVEVTELVRFAASERYLQLRNRRLGKTR
ncbi:MAG: tetratricopeptide repeat protein [Myxococcaceae bacterium]|nr:tetratricopeptide repeat protein [Myxococcaceae bacterium]